MPYNNIMRQIFIGIVVSIVGTFGSLYLGSHYDRPQITWENPRCNYSNILYAECFYYKVADESIGTLYIMNNGSRVVKNVNVILNEEILPSDVKVIDTNASVIVENGKTVIHANSLQPDGGDLDIAFRTKTTKDTFGIYDISTDSGAIEYHDPKGRWWDLSSGQKYFVTLISFISLIGGILLGRKKKH